LGHTTRCIPIINKLLQQGHNVILGGNATTQAVYAPLFTQLPFVYFNGYNITYSKRSWLLPVTLLLQLPKIIRAVKAENQLLASLVKQYNLHQVVADNRFGLHHPNIDSIYITHQLQIQTPFAFITNWLQQWHYKIIAKFNQVWVPDYENTANSLAGNLAHPIHLPTTPISYIGPLSALQKVITIKKYTIGVLLSGPEPQRTILEAELLQKLQKISTPIIFIRGLPQATTTLQMAGHITCYNFLNGMQLATALQQCNFIICRSGYSSIMDADALALQALLIPTPGQTEQMYLAKHLSTRKNFIAQQQGAININAAANYFGIKI
jgi:UDP-N-acetylglucosamine transferase subunit ALG13